MAGKIYIYCGVMLTILAASPAIAENSSVPADYFENLPLVLTASRLKQSAAEAPSAVTVIDHEMIVASGARQIVDLLRLVPGFYVGYYRGSFPVAAYHGLSDAYARRMQVLVDGVSVYSPLYGGVEWAELPVFIQDIERIEVVRGSNAVSYGANAFLAVINIITRDPATEPHVQAALNIGESGIRDVVARVAQHGDDWRYRISLGQRNDDRFTNIPDNSRITLANLRAHYQLNPVDELSFQMRASRGMESAGFFEISNGDVGTPHPRDISQSTLQMRWTHAQSADDEFWVQASHHEQNPREVDNFFLRLPNFPPIPYGINYNYDLKRDDIEFQQLHKLGESLRMVWGGQWRDDSVQSKAFFHDDKSKHNELSRLFGNIEWHPLDKLGVNGGVMLERNSMTGDSFSPRLAATYNLFPGHTLRFGVSRANRAPTLFEEYTNQTYDPPPILAPFTHGLPLKITFLSSANLEDEKILSREIGYVMDIPQWKFSGDMRLFNDQVSKLIDGSKNRPVTALLNNTAFDYYNSSQGVHEQGLELSAHWRPWSGARIDANTAYIRIDSDMPDTQNSAPGHSRSLLFSQSLPRGISFSAAYYMVGNMYWQRSPVELPAYETLDLRLAKRYRWGEQNVEVALVTRNALGNYHDYDMLNIERRISFLQMTIAY